jgi:hypothetical protein
LSGDFFQGGNGAQASGGCLGTFHFEVIQKKLAVVVAFMKVVGR